MRRTSFANMDCSVAQALDVVGEWWSLLVLRDAFQGVRRFDDFQERLGVARNVLADRLSRLVDEGVLEKRLYQQRPDRHEYRLTEKGRDLYPIVVGLMAWGDKWAMGKQGAPVVLTHRTCGHDGTPVLTCPSCGDHVGARDMTYRWKPRRPRETVRT